MTSGTRSSLIDLALAFLLTAGFIVFGGCPAQISNNPATNGVTLSSNDFYVTVSASPGVTMYAHAANGDWNQTPCRISAGTTGRDLRCVIEAQEEDLFFQGVTITYNFPGNMCSYVSRKDFDFYQYKPGPGPSVLYMTTGNTTSASMDGIVTGFGSTSGNSGVGSINPVTTAGGVRATAPTVGASPPSCSTDYSGGGGPNCCSGNYQLNTTAYTHPSPPPSAPPLYNTATTTINGSWGGADVNCLAGPAIDAPDKKLDRNDYPSFIKAFSGSQPLSGKLTIASPFSKNFSTNLYLANYFYDVDNATNLNPTTYPSPLAIYTPGMIAPNSFPYYEFRCIDAADDNINRIRVFVRSWSKNSNFSNLANSTNATNPNGSNANGTETAFTPDPYCDYLTWYGYGVGGSGICSLSTGAYPESQL